MSLQKQKKKSFQPSGLCPVCDVRNALDLFFQNPIGYNAIYIIISFTEKEVKSESTQFWGCLLIFIDTVLFKIFFLEKNVNTFWQAQQRKNEIK